MENVHLVRGNMYTWLEEKCELGYMENGHLVRWKMCTW